MKKFKGYEYFFKTPVHIRTCIHTVHIQMHKYIHSTHTHTHTQIHTYADIQVQVIDV